MLDIEIWKPWCEGKNTYEIAKLLGARESEIWRRLYKIRRAISRRDQRNEYKFRDEGDPIKRGFTGFDSVAGYPRFPRETLK